MLEGLLICSDGAVGRGLFQVKPLDDWICLVVVLASSVTALRQS